MTGRVTAPRRTRPSVKTLLVSTGVAAYLAAAAAGTLLASDVLFALFHRRMPTAPSLTAALTRWQAPPADPHDRKRRFAATTLPALLLFVVVPVLGLGLGRPRRELHGAARFATRPEIEAAGLLGETGIVLGALGPRFILLPGQQSVLLSAPMRSGKGVGVVIPNLLAWPDSVVVCDIKGENWDRTAGFRARHGQKVFGWAPFAGDGRSHRWNPLSAIRPDPRHVVGDILQIAQVLYPTQGQGGTEAFFNDQARNLFLGLVLYLVETPERPRTMGELLRQASGQGRPVPEHCRRLVTEREASPRPLSDACVDALMRFLNTSENTLTSILATLNAPLTVFTEPFVDAATSGDDFSLADVRRRRLSIYLLVPPNRLADAAILLNLFFSQLVHLNTTELPEQNPALKVACLLLMDEFAAMGRITVLEKAIGYLAGYNLRCLTVLQAVSQLDTLYGDKTARTFVTNHAAQILYAPREQRDANEYSEMLGTFTMKAQSSGRSVSHNPRGGGSSHSVNTSDQRRALLLPQEFKEIGEDHAVILIENVKPILADKIRYHREPVFQQRLHPAPELPMIDLEAHRARLEGRVRLAREDEVPAPEQIAVSFAHLPVLGDHPDTPTLEPYVGAFFQALADAHPAAERTPDLETPTP